MTAPARRYSSGPIQPRLQLGNGRLRLFYDGVENYVFDSAGRLLSAAFQHATYRRGLNGKVLRIQRVSDRRFHDTSTLDPRQNAGFERHVKDRLEDSLAQLGPALQALDSALKLDWNADRMNFSSLLGQVGILPPDRYRTLVLNLTEGCSYNRCQFCTFYKNVSFQIRAPDSFEKHIEALVEAFGSGLSYRRGIFLGQANAASLPTQVLAEALHIIRGQFPSCLKDLRGEPRHPLGFETVSAFLDTFTNPTRTVEEWRALRSLGLKHLYLGVESGSPKVLKKIGKPGAPRFVKMLVERLKKADIAVGIIILIGAGGWNMEAKHLAGTVELLHALPLGSGDRIFLSELSFPGEDLNHRDRCRAQSNQLKSFLRIPHDVSVSYYDVRQFVY